MSTNPPIVLLADGKVYQFPGAPEADQFKTEVKAAGGGDVVALAPPLPPAARPLYEIETHLAALLDTEDLLPADQEEAYGVELQRALTEAVEKRDRVGQFVLHLKSQAAFAKAERARLKEREEFYERALAHVEAVITRVVESLGRDAKDKRKRLEGKMLTLALHGCDKRLTVTNEMAVPPKYKVATITLPVETWERLCDSLDLDTRDEVLGVIKSASIEVDKASAKADAKAGIEVPGTRLDGGTYVEVK